ncbi:MAG: hypothetical protein ALECFALPRED_005870 [Alectoria fallacina]|uniref:Uncharacterized protein n=1 Tax=Alectoria fallacina TaxID=1903189 RepID=A0A8H3G1Q1_9LECA|nr:MAG: hypothetical protein ALECFALPRED_005870 [Alectoria fallacina]
MDVTGHTFQSQLFSILGAISRSHFVSFDLELSGIKQFKPKPTGQSEDGKQTLQQRYEETKAAAERYHVLQLGLTCVEEDRERGVYVARPYNFYLNPVPDKKLNVERDFSYQSGAVEFLLGHGFRMEAPFLEGVPYFSREEEAASRAAEVAKRDRNSFVDIFIRDGDTESLEFIQRVRQEVTAWRNRVTPEPSYLNIGPINLAAPGYNGRGLNGYQKRLVHQLVRAEFPDVVSLSKQDFIQLVPFDQKREDAQLQRKIAWFENNLARQVGMRWLAEAMCPDVDKVLSKERVPPFASGNLAALMTSTYPPMDMTDEEQEAHTVRFAELCNTLKEKRTVLVGHNLFLDLIYFFTFFFGPLPDRVEGFQKTIAQLFPLVFDTKYLADKINDNSPLYKSSLQEIDQELSKLPVPIIETPFEHSKYLSDSPFHEAGFDSFTTAKVLIRLSARIEGAANGDESPSSEDEIYYPASEDGSLPSDLNELLTRKSISDEDALNRRKQIAQVFQKRAATETPAETQAALDRQAALFRDLGLDDEEPQSETQTDNRPQTSTNPYALLQELSLNGDIEPQSAHVIAAAIPAVHTMMPAGGSPFWIRYGNKLRVNGTVEEVCIVE